ncbi:type VII secretion target [Mycolicibacterium tusciae]|uniref:type VII secretion target n=1 Tax=Mycolicibacterium tusciae TaxID=75922 RepID=UPI00024A1211|nr:type VII secretion target [Mycolicibacterium tusciae]
MTEDLRVDTALVRQSGGKLETIAGLIPEPPAAFSPAGADALSTAIAGRVAEVVDPVIAQMPITKEELTRFAQNVMQAADSYDSTDRQIAEEILKRLGLFEDAAGAGGGSPAGGTGGAPGATGFTTAGSPAAGGGQSDQMGQLMQMAQQAAQIPMQLAGLAAAIPQAMMQGVQSAVQQASQLAQSGEGEEKLPGEDEQMPEEDREERPEDKLEPQAEAAPGNSGGERVPDAGLQEPAPQAPPAPKPAPTRPAESGPEIAL